MGLHGLVVSNARHLHHLVGEGLGHDIHFAVGAVLHHGVALGGVQSDGQVAGQGPDGGGPDHEAQLGLVQMAQLALVVVHGKLHIHGGAGVVLILDLGLRQGGLIVIAPVDRLEALVDIALLVHLAEDLDLLSLEAGVHGLVGVLPVGHHAQALEALHLDADILLGIGMAGGAEIGDAHGLAVELLLLDDGALDGHAMVVPAGDIGGVAAPHGVGPGDDVLQGLIQGMTHVEAAVGERRAVVEGKAGFALVLFQQLIVEVHILPALEHFRLPLGQARPHGEVGLGQIDGLVVIHDASPFIFVSFLCLSVFDRNRPAVPAEVGFRPQQPHSFSQQHISRPGRQGKSGDLLRPEHRAFAGKVSLFHGLTAYRTLHRQSSFTQNKKRFASELRDKAFENTLRYHSSCRSPCGARPLTPAITG